MGQTLYKSRSSCIIHELMDSAQKQYKDIMRQLYVEHEKKTRDKSYGGFFC